VTPLRQRMIEAMTLRGFAPSTREAYIRAVRDLAAHYKRSPDQLSVDQLQHYLLHCLQARQLSHSSCLQILHALRFFYIQTLGWSSADLELPRPKRPQRLPEILNRAELARLFAATRNLKHRTMLMTTYAAGLRVSEVVNLRVSDIDSERMAIRIEQGKGCKDRYSLLTPTLLDALRDYVRRFRPTTWLFPNRDDRNSRLAITSVQRAYTQAKCDAGIAKQGGIHALRHAFATHQLESGMPIHRLQRILGHRCLRTTTRYLHLAEQPGFLAEAAADLLAPTPTMERAR
jgi:integrase/recombinase XerD